MCEAKMLHLVGLQLNAEWITHDASGIGLHAACSPPNMRCPWKTKKWKTKKKQN